MIKFDLKNKEHCYILGYFWADSCLSKKGNSYSFSFEVKTTDFLMIWHILQSAGFQKYSTRKRKNSINSQSCVWADRKENVEFFKKYSFDRKKEDCSLYYDLDEEMKKYFILGFLDGDGSVSLDKNGLFRVGFNGPIDQNFGFLEHFCSSYSIAYTIYRKSRLSHHESHKKKIHEYSVFEFTKVQSRINFCKIMERLGVGLRRKIDVFKLFRTTRQQKEREFNPRALAKATLYDFTEMSPNLANKSPAVAPNW